MRRNRELADAMASAGSGDWQVTVAAPAAFPGDLGPVVTRREPSDQCELRTVPVRTASRIHVMTYGRGLRALLDEPWDVVHCWEEPYVLAAAQIARGVGGRAMLVYSSFQNIDKRYPWPFSALERYSMRRAAGWIAFGRSVEAALAGRSGYADRPHVVIPFGVDPSRFSPNAGDAAELKRHLGWAADGPPVVGFLGRFIEAKGLPLLLRALDDLHGRGIPWRALFVGGGSWEPNLHAFAARHPGLVHVATGVSHDEVPAYLRAMDVLCAPSQTTPGWREQFGRMIVEAFACGTPVISSDSGELPHVVGDAGVVVDERSPAGWTAALERVLSDPAMRQSLGARGRARAEGEFAWSVVGRRHLEFFHRLLDA
ncbi:MAG TPA: glycosyltransferase family 4 protein [Gemmatimonadaceae bacterium]|nr:glycosyltransferase family 4 protein [Gemmatimonadaceae bacterium]